jgi:hypothetical protein
MRPLSGSAQKMSKSYRHVATGVILPVLLGLAGFFDLSQRPGYANFRAVDVFQLIAAGMCFGIALTGLIEFLRGMDTGGSSSE